VELHRIQEDLERHAWHCDLVLWTVAGAEAFASRWATFEQAVAALELDRADD
jgi:hypothetical protein